jgi:hypothetical protein
MFNTIVFTLYRYDVSSIIQDVRNELVYTSERYDTPVLSSTLNRRLYLGGLSKTISVDTKS